MKWWKNESELVEIDIPECFGDEGATTCSMCILSYRVYETICKLKSEREHKESYKMFHYWIHQVRKRYNKEAQVFVADRIEQAIVDDRREIVSSEIDDIVNGISN